MKNVRLPSNKNLATPLVQTLDGVKIKRRQIVWDVRGSLSEVHTTGALLKLLHPCVPGFPTVMT